MKNKMKKSILYIIALGLFAVSCSDLQMGGGDIPTVTTLEATSVTRSTAVLCGETSGGVENMVSRGVCFSTSDRVEFGDPAVSVIKGSGKFSKVTHELEAVTKYYMRAFAVMRDGTIHYGEVRNFTTKDFSPAELGLPATVNVLSKEAQIQAEVTYEGDYHISEYGFIYAKTPDVMHEGAGVKKAVAVRKDNVFTATLLDLEIGTEYYVKAYAKTEMGYSYSEEMSFTTSSKIPAELADITVVDNTVVALKISSEVTATQTTVTEYGFCWSTENPVPNKEDETVNLMDKDFVHTLGGYKPNTKLYIRAYAVNDAGINYSKVLEIRIKSYDCGGKMVKIIPLEEFYIGWLGETYKGANDGDEGLNPYGASLVKNMAPYRIAAYEVTYQDYADFLNVYKSTTVKDGANKGKLLVFSEFNKFGYDEKTGLYSAPEDKKNHPAVGITWFGATEFCLFYGGFLPDEAQWENAARANFYSDDPANPMFMYSGSNDLNEVAVNSVTEPTAVGTKKPNQIGLYDMSGNAQEWTSSPWIRTYPDTWSNGGQSKTMVARGCRAQRGAAQYFLNCSREGFGPDTFSPNKSNFLGFRFCDYNID